MLSISLTSDKGTLHDFRRRILDDMISEVENAIEKLRHDQQHLEGERKLCNDCQRWKHSYVKRCSRCFNEKLRPEYCTAECRTMKFLGDLRLAELWPFSRQKHKSPRTFWKRTEYLQMTFYHVCEGKDICPLAHTVNTLQDRVGGVTISYTGARLR